MKKQHKKLTLISVILACTISSPQILAHSKFQITTAEEGATVYNNISIGHGCENPKPEITTKLPVIANRMILPDATGTVFVNGVATSEPITNYLTNWPGTLFKNVPSTSTFATQDVVLTSDATSPIGKSSTSGKVPGDFNTGLIPFVLKAPSIKTGPDNCALSVTLEGAIADICKFTTTKNLTVHTANIWMSAGTGSKFDSYNLDGLGSPALFKITRLITNPIPAGCGAGTIVVIKPTATQLNTDLPIKGRWANN